MFRVSTALFVSFALVVVGHKDVCPYVVVGILERMDEMYYWKPRVEELPLCLVSDIYGINIEGVMLLRSRRQELKKQIMQSVKDCDRKWFEFLLKICTEEVPEMRKSVATISCPEKELGVKDPEELQHALKKEEVTRRLELLNGLVEEYEESSEILSNYMEVRLSTTSANPMKFEKNCLAMNLEVLKSLRKREKDRAAGLRARFQKGLEGNVSTVQTAILDPKIFLLEYCKHMDDLDKLMKNSNLCLSLSTG